MADNHMIRGKPVTKPSANPIRRGPNQLKPFAGEPEMQTHTQRVCGNLVVRADKEPEGQRNIGLKSRKEPYS